MARGRLRTDGGTWVLRCVLAAVGVWGFACKPEEADRNAQSPSQTKATAPPPATYEHTFKSNDQTFTVSFTPSPSPIPMNEPFTLDVAIASSESGVDGAKLAVDAAMPAHRHGMNTQPRVTPQGDGRFKAEGMLFHMPGHWELYFDISIGAVTERAQFDVHLE